MNSELFTIFVFGIFSNTKLQSNRYKNYLLYVGANLWSVLQNLTYKKENKFGVRKRSETKLSLCFSEAVASVFSGKLRLPKSKAVASLRFATALRNLFSFYYRIFNNLLIFDFCITLYMFAPKGRHAWLAEIQCICPYI